MCIYCGTTKYRKIYENHSGAIPKYDMGRKYNLNQGNLSSVISGRPGFKSIGGWKLL